ncbi:hypothetical protein VE02_04370 [Pseudogymnoascus sp. 03VT05]|nr:hypothetical protein VE02_04370 [Pseudogymnoascus sp. 03VT05]
MSRTLNLPFAEIVALDSQTSAAVIKPPAYATKRGFSFNLDVLASVPLTLKPGEVFDFAKLDGGPHSTKLNNPPSSKLLVQDYLSSKARQAQEKVIPVWHSLRLYSTTEMQPT